MEACRKDFVDKNPALVTQYVKDITAGLKMALANRDETLKVVNEVMKAPIPVLDSYLLKANDFAREPGAAPNFAAIQAMFDVYTETHMIGKSSTRRSGIRRSTRRWSERSTRGCHPGRSAAESRDPSRPIAEAAILTDGSRISPLRAVRDDSGGGHTTGP